jgi:hypothetical protein
MAVLFINFENGKLKLKFCLLDKKSKYTNVLSFEELHWKA